MQIIDLTNIKKQEIENHTSKGNQPKWHINNNWYKADFMGYEALAEYIVSELLKKSNISNFVKYDLIKIHYEDKNYIGCVSKNFKNNNEMLIPIEKFHRQYYGKSLAYAIAEKEDIKDKISYTVDFIEYITGLKEVGKYITVMLTIDAFFLNEDRHTNNIAVIRNEILPEYRFAPIFDNGLSLLADTNDYSLKEDVFKNIQKAQAKPFDTDFDKQLNAAEELYGICLKFSFTKNDIYKIINDVSDIYDKEILYRVETILLEQIRKYQYLF